MWYLCDGNNGVPRPVRPTRRQVIGGSVAAVLSAWAMGRGGTALADVKLSKDGGNGDALVMIFLRGAADGLSVVVPHGDDDYYRARPTLALKAPKGGSKETALPLNDFFGLHPALAPLHPFYKDGRLAAVHAVGSYDQTRSHFEAMAAMERGLAGGKPAGSVPLLDDAGHSVGLSSGWLARHLTESPASRSTPLRAVAFGNLLPDGLRGATDASAVASLSDFSLQGWPDARRQTLSALYAGSDDGDAILQAGGETLSALKTLEALDPANYKPESGAKYEDGSELANGLRQVACLLKADIGMEAAWLDHRGAWDTHFAQGNATGLLASQLSDVGGAVAAFAQDLGEKRMERVTVLVMTEFGRRVAENGSLGTDHGRASVMLLLGGGIVGGAVYAKWPGLKPANLEAPGDLPVTTDYRDVLSEVLQKRRHVSPQTLARIFPRSESYRPLGLAHAAKS